MTAKSRKLDKYAALQLLLTQQRWDVLPPIIITTGIRGNIHTQIIKNLQKLNMPNHKIHKLMETLSKIAIKYLKHIILNKLKREKKLPPIPLDYK